MRRKSHFSFFFPSTATLEMKTISITGSITVSESRRQTSDRACLHRLICLKRMLMKCVIDVGSHFSNNCFRDLIGRFIFYVLIKRNVSKRSEIDFNLSYLFLCAVSIICNPVISNINFTSIKRQWGDQRKHVCEFSFSHTDQRSYVFMAIMSRWCTNVLQWAELCFCKTFLCFTNWF